MNGLPDGFSMDEPIRLVGDRGSIKTWNVAELMLSLNSRLLTCQRREEIADEVRIRWRFMEEQLRLALRENADLRAQLEDAEQLREDALAALGPDTDYEEHL